MSCLPLIGASRCSKQICSKQSRCHSDFDLADKHVADKHLADKPLRSLRAALGNWLRITLRLDGALTWLVLWADFSAPISDHSNADRSGAYSSGARLALPAYYPVARRALYFIKAVIAAGVSLIAKHRVATLHSPLPGLRCCSA